MKDQILQSTVLKKSLRWRDYWLLPLSKKHKASYSTIKPDISHKHNDPTVLRKQAVDLLETLFNNRLKISKTMEGWEMNTNLEDWKQRLDKSKESPIVLCGVWAVF